MKTTTNTQQGFLKNLIDIEPYIAGEQPKSDDIIKLNANENPYEPSPMVKKAIADFSANELNKYPSADSDILRQALARKFSLTPEHFFIGNGSDDVLALAFRAFFNSDKPIIYPEITYSFYPVWCKMFDIPYKTFKLKDNFDIDVNDFCAENGGVVLANPNAPTAICQNLGFVREVIERNPDSVVIVDEAYIDFGNESAIKLVKEYDNLCVVQTFSKSRSLAGLRIGYACCGKALMPALRAAKDSYNSYPLDSVALVAGTASVMDEEYFTATTQKVVKTRERVSKELKDLGFEMTKSATNFLFATHPQKTALEIKNYLADNNVYIRHFNKEGISNYLRITIGTDEQMDIMIDLLKKLFK